MINASLPTSQNLGFLSKGANPPDPNTATLWLRTDGTGVPLGFNVWLDGTWNEFLSFNSLPQWRRGNWLAEREDLARQGFVLADGTNGTQDFTSEFEVSASNPTNYSWFAVVYKGRQIVG